jgi:hypothetical protein
MYRQTSRRDPGVVSSLAHPGGNVTGSSFLNTELSAKRLELLHETLPDIRQPRQRRDHERTSSQPTKLLVLRERDGSRKFAPDSSLEGTGFEPSVPGHGELSLPRDLSCLGEALATAGPPLLAAEPKASI